MGSCKETDLIIHMEINMLHPHIQTAKVVIRMMVMSSETVQLLHNFILAILNIIEVSHHFVFVFIPMGHEGIHINLDASELFNNGFHGDQSYNMTRRMS